MKTLIALFSLLNVSLLQAQNADDIINKHIDAIGGTKMLSQANSIYTESGIEIMGSVAPTKTFIVNGKGYRSENIYNGQQIVQVVTDKNGWTINPYQGSESATALPSELYVVSEDQVYVSDPLFNYAAHGGKVSFAGQEKVDNINAYKIKYTNKDNAVITYYIDPATYFIIKSVRSGELMGQNVEVTTNYSNYKKTDYGITIPFTSEMQMGQMNLTMNVNKAEVNKDIQMTIFDMPK